MPPVPGLPRENPAEFARDIQTRRYAGNRRPQRNCPAACRTVCASERSEELKRNPNPGPVHCLKQTRVVLGPRRNAMTSNIGTVIAAYLLFVISPVLAQGAGGGGAGGTAAGGTAGGGFLANWWWVILLVIVAGAAIWYFTTQRPRV